MSRLAKCKLEKAKVKVAFPLQFHATHVPQAGWDKPFISFFPADSIKATAKTTKALVRYRICKWGVPIYETTRLLQDTRTKQYDEKLYKIVVAMVTIQLLTSETGFREFEQQRELCERGPSATPEESSRGRIWSSCGLAQSPQKEEEGREWHHGWGSDYLYWTLHLFLLG